MAGNQYGANCVAARSARGCWRTPHTQVEALIRDLCSGGSVRVELIMRWMGLAHVRGSAVGDAMTRGLSGGERKRLTCAEMLVGQRRVLLLVRNACHNLWSCVCMCVYVCVGGGGQHRRANKRTKYSHVSRALLIAGRDQHRP